MSLKKLALDIAAWRTVKGFYTPPGIFGDEGDLMLGKLMLVVTELSEAAEAIRHEDQENYEEELADTFIRLLDIVGTQRIDIEKVIKDKMSVNWQRPTRHGKATKL